MAFALVQDFPQESGDNTTTNQTPSTGRSRARSRSRSD